jgi:hypothetical protein
MDQGDLEGNNRPPVRPSQSRLNMALKSDDERFALAVGAAVIALASLVGVLAASVLLRYLLPGYQETSGEDTINAHALRDYKALTLYFLVAATWTYFVWDATNTSWRRGWLYGIAVLFFGSFSFGNYMGGAMLIPVRYQALINIPFAFVSMVCVSSIWGTNFTLIEARILKYITLFAVATFGAVLPIVFSLLYVAVRLGMIHKDELQPLFMSGSVYVLCSIAGIAVSALNYIVMQRIKAPSDRDTSCIG